MDADAVIEGVKRRLLGMAADPPFRFRETSRAAAEGYMRRMTTFEGCTEAEVAAAEAALGVRFTDVFRAYLRQMGVSRGHLLCGSDVAGPSQFEEFRRFARDLMRETGPAPELPGDAVVFLTHQGYQFSFLHPRGGFDCPVWNFVEYGGAPKRIADSFAAFLDAEMALTEENHRTSHGTGGHYVTVGDAGGTSAHYPARSSGDRATGKPFTLGDR